MSVYFIKPVGMDGPIKIGSSYNAEVRLLEAGAWSPIPLEIIGEVPGGLSDENFLHRCLANDRSHREWFHATPRVLDIVARIIAVGSIAPARETLKPEGSIRKKPSGVWDTQHKRVRESAS